MSLYVCVFYKSLKVFFWELEKDVPKNVCIRQSLVNMFGFQFNFAFLFLFLLLLLNSNVYIEKKKKEYVNKMQT